MGLLRMLQDLSYAIGIARNGVLERKIATLLFPRSLLCASKPNRRLAYLMMSTMPLPLGTIPDAGVMKAEWRTLGSQSPLCPDSSKLACHLICII